MKKIILASSSPRRSELLKKLDISFDIKDSNLDETKFSYQDPKELVKTLAYEKAKSVLENTSFPDDICVIGADTVVCFNDKILTKPKDKSDALNILLSLNDNSHFVYTGLSLIGYKNGSYFEETLVSSSCVYFSKFSKEELINYIDTLEPMDKAGAYGIQGKGGFLVSKIEGDFYSIMGLPLNKTYNLLRKYKFLCNKNFTK